MSTFPFFPDAPFERAAAIRRLGLALLLAVGFAATAATASAAAPGSLSLDEAVRLAEEQAPTITARQAAMEAATAAIGPAGELPDPEFVAGVDNLPVTTGDAFSLTRDFMTMRKVGVMQTFTRRDKRDLRRQRAQAGAEREHALLLDARLGVQEATAKAWVARWTGERRLALLDSLRSRADARIAAAEAAVTSGRGTAADALMARASRVALDDRITQAARELDNARADFARWLPDAGERPLGEPPSWRDLGADPDAVLRHVGEHRELLTYAALEHAANADLELARADKKPDWSVEFDFAQRGPRYSNMVSLEVRVPLPIFAASRQDPLIASKRAAVAQIEAEREAALRMHTADLRKTLATWHRAVERADRYEHELLPLAEDRAETALAAYRGGRGDLQATLGAFDNVVEQRIAYADLLGELGEAWATLHFAFPRED